VCNGGEYQ
jgi:hypothetical protein